MKLTRHALFTVVLLVVALVTPSCKQRPRINVENYYQAAAQSAETGNFSQALWYANKAVTLQPSPRSLALKATLLYQAGRLQESKKNFELALAERSISPFIKTTILNNYAAVLVRLGYRNKASQIWQHLTKDKCYATPEVAWFNLGLLAWEDSQRLRRKKPKQAALEARRALNYFSTAIKLEPQYVDAYFYKAKIFDAYKNKKDAAALLKKVIALAPNHQHARKMLRTLS